MQDSYQDQVREYIVTNGLTETTLKSYLTYLKRFKDYFNLSLSLDQMDISHIKEYQKYLIAKGRLSNRTINSHMSALTCYYAKILGRHDYYHLVPRLKTKRTLPIILTEEEVQSMIEVVNKPLWKALLIATYSAGLRTSEVLNLKVTDVDSKRMVLSIHKSKSGKSREALLSPHTLEALRMYWRVNRLRRKIKSDYLFISDIDTYETPNKQRMSHSTLNYIVKKAAELAGVKKKFIHIV
jgi:site-specific recombinase XerD